MTAALDRKHWFWIGDVYRASSLETLAASKSLIAGFTLPPVFIQRLINKSFDKTVDISSALQTWLQVEDVVKNGILNGELGRIQFQIMLAP